MYSIYVDNICIFNDQYSDDDYRLIDPKLKMSDSSAGSLEFIMPPNNVGYNSIIRLQSEIVVYRNDEEIWSGRALKEDLDFWNNKQVFCEGELAYLNDTTQPQKEYHSTVRGFLTSLIQVHNAKANANQRFTVGAVTVTDNNDSIYRYTNYENTLEAINEKLVSRLGGHLRIRKVNGVRYLDYLKDYPRTNEQVIRFGENLLDFTKSFDMTNYCTVLLPRGAQLEENEIEALTKYLTIESVNDGSPYLQIQQAVQQFGWIEKIVDWDDVTEPANLKRKGQQYLNDVQFDEMTLSLSALDLHYLNIDVMAFELLDEVRCISEPHGMDHLFPISEIDIPLNNPENTRFILGNVITLSLTSSTRETNENILKKIEKLPTRQSVLKEAKENATEIMNMATNGYVTTVISDGRAQELIISDNPDYTQAQKLWRWNLNGFGYSKTGYEGQFGLAITMDGAIVADFITAGTLNADIIRAGIIMDKLGYNYWNLDTGEFSLSPNTSIGDSTIQEYIDQSGESVLAQANSYVNEQVEIIQEQIDGNIDSYYYDYEPTNNNVPASTWRTEEDKKKHEGDIFFWKSRGYAYRYMKIDGVWGWQLIQDSDITSAIAKANQALEEVEGKITTYAQSSKPTENLSVGDMWINTANQNILYRWNGTQWVSVRDSLIIEANNKASLAKKYADEAKNEIKVLDSIVKELETEYGYNILRGTNDTFSLTSSGQWNLSLWRASGNGTGTRTGIAIGSNRPQENIVRGWRFGNSSTVTLKTISVAQDNVPVINGEKYTMSCYAKGTGTLNMFFGFDRYSAKRYVLKNINNWTRYSWTFTASSSADSSGKYLVKNGKTNIFFGNVDTGTLEICGMQLELGSTVHDYQPSPEEGAIKSLKEATTQQSIFNSLTNNGKVQGIKLSNGNLYINASYINSGTLSANYLKTGLITDKKGLSKWNLDNGIMDLKVQQLKIKSGNTYISVDPNTFRLSTGKLSWQSDNSSLTAAGKLSCKNADISGIIQTGNYETGSYFKMAEGRINAFYKKTNIGYIGSNNYNGDDNYKGLVFDLETGGKYMAWAAKMSSTDKVYTLKLTYTRSTKNEYKSDSLNLGCDLDLHWHYLRNIKGTKNGTFRFCLPKGFANDGTVTEYYSNCYLKFANGLLVDARMP